MNLFKLRDYNTKMLMCEPPPGVGTTTTQRQIIQDKISIPSPTGCVPRQRLLNLLEVSLSACNSTVISGRAGSGKTTLLLDFIQKLDRDVAWYKVDAPEVDSRIFFEYLIHSISTQRPGFGNCGLRALLDVESDDIRSLHLAEHFVFELERQSGNPLLIVIEDLHLVCDSTWLVPFLQRLLPLLPADVHILITSRTMPPAPLWRMRSKQTLSVIDEETLAFTRDEAVRLFEQYGLSREQASIALDHSHGRAAALSNLAATLYFAERESLAG